MWYICCVNEGGAIVLNLFSDSGLDKLVWCGLASVEWYLLNLFVWQILCFFCNLFSTDLIVEYCPGWGFNRQGAWTSTPSFRSSVQASESPSELVARLWSQFYVFRSLYRNFFLSICIYFSRSTYQDGNSCGGAAKCKNQKCARKWNRLFICHVSSSDDFIFCSQFCLFWHMFKLKRLELWNCWL